ncbi:hypothetical protein Tco_0073965 [Tanacetum coccineum]
MGLKLLSPSYPLYFWLGKGRPLSPEAHGRLVRLLRAKLKPRELVLPPDELFETEESRDFLEYSLLYGWMDAPVRVLQGSISTGPQPVVDDHHPASPYLFFYHGDFTEPSIRENISVQSGAISLS